MDTIISLVTTGVQKLIELVPLWMQSSAEQRAKIEAATRSAVDSLDKVFVDADVKDDANTRAAREAIERARGGK